MVSKISITDNTKTPISYLPNIPNFSNGKIYEFKPGVNLIIGENGCGKTTLLNIIKYYLLVDYVECGRGTYNLNISRISRSFSGIDVYADYTKNTFRLCHPDEKSNNSDAIMENINSFSDYVTQSNSSQGEKVILALNSLFNYMFGPNAKLTFDYESELSERCPEYYKYIQDHTDKNCPDEYTILMDEPDRNLSLSNIEQIKDILSFHKEQTQLIASIHNPILIYPLSKLNDINIIEMTPGYINNINKIIKNL